MQPDYQKMYYTLMNASEKALEILIAAQNECEEIYLSAQDDEKDNEEKE